MRPGTLSRSSSCQSPFGAHNDSGARPSGPALERPRFGRFDLRRVAAGPAFRLGFGAQPETTLKPPPLPLLLLFLGVTACQTPPTADPAVSAADGRGRELAQTSCAGCHAIERYGMSPNPSAPPFASIVNQRELTTATLSSWLRDAHNYPQDMEFTLGEGEVEALVAYMLTLKDPNYRPPV